MLISTFANRPTIQRRGRNESGASGAGVLNRRIFWRLYNNIKDIKVKYLIKSKIILSENAISC